MAHNNCSTVGAVLLAGLISQTVGQGLKVQFYNGMNFDQPIGRRVDSLFDYNWGFGAPMQGAPRYAWTARWTGTITPDSTGPWYFFLEGNNSGWRLWVNNSLLIDMFDRCCSFTQSEAAIFLRSGQSYPIRIEFQNDQYDNPASFKVQWGFRRSDRHVVPPRVLDTTSLSHAPQYPLTASDFVSSIGLGVMVTDAKDFDTLVKPRLAELGVRKLRVQLRHRTDGYQFNGDSVVSRINQLSSLGYKMCGIIGSWYVTDGSAGGWAKTMEAIESASGALEAVECANEADLSNERFQYMGNGFASDGSHIGDGWETGLSYFTRDLYTHLKSDAATRNIPLVGDALGNYSAAQGLASRSQDLLGRPLEDYFDYGNMHAYHGATMPTGDLHSWFFSKAGVLNPAKQYFCTETGYNTDQVSETAQAKYILRTYLTHWNAGIIRSYVFKLDVRGYDDGYSLLDAIGKPKKSFAALKNMLALLNDNSTGQAVAGPLDFELAGDVSSIMHVCLQKSTGTHYLILWQEVPSWDDGTKQDITVIPRRVTVKLYTSVHSAALYRPVEGAPSLASYTGVQEIAVDIPDHPLIMEIVPASTRVLSSAQSWAQVKSGGAAADIGAYEYSTPAGISLTGAARGIAAKGMSRISAIDGKLPVLAPGQESALVDIFDSRGRRCARFRTDGRRTGIALPSVASGVYAVQIR